MTSLILTLAFALAADPLPSPRLDLYGDALPDGAIARMGSVQLRHASLGGMTVLADGKTLAAASYDRRLRFWNLETGPVQVRTARVGDGMDQVQQFDISSDGKTAVVIDAGRVTVWDVASNKRGPSFALPNETRPDLFWWDGNRDAVLRQDFRVVLWDRETGKEREIKFPPRGNIGGDSTYHARLSPNGKWVAGLGGWEQPFCVFDAADGREVHRFTCNATTSAFSPGGTQVVVADMTNDKGGREVVMRFFDLATGIPVRQLALGHSDYYYSLAFSPDGKRLACGFSDRSVVLDSVSGKVVYPMPGRPIWSLFTPDGRTLVANYGHRLRAWDTATWKERFPRPGEFGYNAVLAVSPDGRFLASGDWMETSVSIWDAATGKWVREIPVKGEGRYVRSLAFTSDGRSLIAGQMTGFLQWWDVETGNEIRSLQLDAPDKKVNRFLYCYALHVSPDRTCVATTDRTFDRNGEYTRVSEWDAATGKIKRQFTLPGATTRCAWSDDGTEIMMPLGDGLKRLDITTGQTIWQAADATDRRIAASPAGQSVATISPATDSAERIVHVWETATGMEITHLKCGRSDHFALAADGRHLVTTDIEFLRVWDLATGRERVRYGLPDPSLATGGATVVTALVLSPDGRRAFTSMSDGTALVWDLTPTGRAESLVGNATATDLDRWWGDLAGADAGKAYAALWRMAEAPADGIVSQIRKNLKPVREPDAERVEKWIEQLGDPKFAVRDAAARELSAVGPVAFPALRKVLEGNPSAELRRRANELLAKPKGLLSRDAVTGIRAVAVLERIGTSDAKKLLAELAAGASEHDLTRAAAAALGRSPR